MAYRTVLYATTFLVFSGSADAQVDCHASENMLQYMAATSPFPANCDPPIPAKTEVTVKLEKDLLNPMDGDLDQSAPDPSQTPPSEPDAPDLEITILNPAKKWKLPSRVLTKLGEILLALLSVGGAVGATKRFMLFAKGAM